AIRDAVVAAVGANPGREMWWKRRYGRVTWLRETGGPVVGCFGSRPKGLRIRTRFFAQLRGHAVEWLGCRTEVPHEAEARIRAPGASDGGLICAGRRQVSRVLKRRRQLFGRAGCVGGVLPVQFLLRRSPPCLVRHCRIK